LKQSSSPSPEEKLKKKGTIDKADKSWENLCGSEEEKGERSEQSHWQAHPSRDLQSV
jgi:hypothetical protein